MSLNLQKINSDDFFNELIDKLNSNFEAISISNGGPEGKQGVPGVAGLPGARGPVGAQGPQGIQGTVWYKADNPNTLPSSGIKEGDFVIVVSNGDFYQYISSVWTKIGTFNFSQGLTIDKEETLYNFNYAKASTELNSLINSRTNNKFLLTNMDRPDEDLGVQIPNADSPGDSYPLIQGDDASFSYLYDYRMMIYSSGNSEDDSEQIFGRNLHLANSFGMVTKANWLKASGFTISSDLDVNSVNATQDGTEILRFTGVSSGSPGHVHRIQFDNTDFWVSSFRVTKGGQASLGFTNSYTPKQKLDIDGGLLIGNSTVTGAGSIRYDGTNFQGHNGTEWVNLDITVNDLLTALGNDITSFQNKVIRTDTTGGVVLGDMTIEPTPIAGSIRYNSTTKDFEGYNGTSWVTLNNKVLPNSDNNNGGGFQDEEGNSISSKIAVNADGTDNTGPLVYEGIVFTSEDDSLAISQEVLESKYAKINLSARGTFGATDGDGNPISINEIDITSDDIDVTKTTTDGKLTYNLGLSGTEVFREAVNRGIDVRSSDGTILAEPPSSESPYWDIKVNPNSTNGGGSVTESVATVLKDVSKYQVSANRYTQLADTLTLSYSASLGGHYSYLAFGTKDFDENCNVTSTDPFEVSISNDYNGIYHVSARARFTYTTAPAGGTTNIKLVVLNTNTIVATLKEYTSSDLVTGGLTAGDIIELQGSDTIDLSCVTGDCNSILRLAIIAVDGTSGTGTITMSDSSVSIHKIVSISQNKVDDFINSSNKAFKNVEVTNSNGVATTVSSQTVSGNLALKSGTYGNVYVSGDNVFIDANITAISQEIETNYGSGALSPAFANVRVGAFTTAATSNSIIEFAGSDDIDVTLSGTKVVISSSGNAASVTNYYSDTTLVESAYSGNVIFKDGLSASSTSNGVEVTLDSSISGSTDTIHVYSDYYDDIFTVTQGAITSMINGVFIYGDYDLISENRVASVKYKSSSEEFISSGVGSIDTLSSSDGLKFTPAATGKYEITISMRSTVVLTRDGANPSVDLGVVERATLNAGLFQLDGGSVDFGGGNDTAGTSSTLVKHIGSNETEIKVDKSFNKTNSKFHRTNFTTIIGTTTLELTKDIPYGFGLYKGRDLPIVRVLNVSGSEGRFKPVVTEDSMKIILMDADITIKKLS